MNPMNRRQFMRSAAVATAAVHTGGMSTDAIARLAKAHDLNVLFCSSSLTSTMSMPLGVMALGTTPVRSAKEGSGEVDVTIRFAGVTFDVGSYVYANEDGIIVSPEPLQLTD